MVSKHNDSKRPRLGRPPKDLAGDVKARLMQRRGLSENDAYRMLRRRAMDEGRRIVDIAAAILEC